MAKPAKKPFVTKGASSWAKLRALPPEQRPKFIPMFPQGWIYFRSWRTCRWFLALLVPVAASGVAAIVRTQLWIGALILGLLGLAVASCLFDTLMSGMSSSNIGTFFRDREPVRYWRDVAIIGAGYGLIAAAGYFL